MNYPVLDQFPLIVLLAVAAVTDARARRIPNWLTLLLLCSGIARAFLSGAPFGPGSALAGVFVAGTIPFGQFALGAVGAGDVKLMAGVGAWLGPVGGLLVFAAQAVIGGVMALAQSAAQGRLADTLRNTVVVSNAALQIRHLGLDHVRRTGQHVVTASEGGHKSRRLPFAIPVLASVLLLLARKGVFQ